MGDRNNRILNTKIELIKQKDNLKGKFSLFDSSFAREFFSKDLEYNKRKYFFDLINDWDEKCNIPYNIGISLDRIAKDNTVMIHRTKLDIDNDVENNENLQNIMNNGLRNYGHGNAVGGSAFVDDPSLTLTMTPLKGISGWINLLSSWHENDSVIIAAFPKELVKDDGEFANDKSASMIYDYNGKIPSVKSEYLVGVIIKKEDTLDEFYTRDEIKEFGNKIER